jgi:phenylacetate-CoA ligase
MTFNETIKKLLRYPYSLLPYKYRLHNSYYSTKNFLKKKCIEKNFFIKNYQLNKIKEIIKYAYKYCPGYYQLYKESSISPKEINKLEDIFFFPYITKEILRDNLKDFVSRDLNLEKKHYVTTSGSTGIPFGFYNTKKENAIELAFIHNGWESNGWVLGEPSIVLRGSFIGSENEISYYNPSTRELNISSYYLEKKTYIKFKELYLSKSILNLQAYPSSAVNLANLVIENDDIKKINFKFLFLGSENLTSWQEKILKKAFPNVKIICWYGHVEKCALAFKYPQNNFYNVIQTYGYTEVAKNNKKKNFYNKEIISTSFFIKTVPFIRYRTNDYATGILNNNRSISKIYLINGREHEFIQTASGRKIYISSLNMHDRTFDCLKEFQFFQKDEGLVIFKFVPKFFFNILDEKNIFLNLKKKLGNDVKLEIKKVSLLKRSNNNKLSFIDKRI